MSELDDYKKELKDKVEKLVDKPFKTQPQVMPKKNDVRPMRYTDLMKIANDAWNQGVGNVLAIIDGEDEPEIVTEK